MLVTLCLDVVLGAVEIAFSLGPSTLYLTTFILGLSIGQMALSLILWMRDVSRWRVLLAALVISFLFGLTVSMHEQGADFDPILVVLVSTLIFGITPVAIYRVVFVGLQVQFSLSILFGLMTLVTIACAVTIQLDIDAEWFLTYLFFFIGSAIPIPLAGFMLVRRHVPSTYRYVLMMALLTVIFVIVAASAEHGLRDVSLAGQIGAFMSLYLLLGGIALLREIRLRTSLPVESSQPSEDPIAAD